MQTHQMCTVVRWLVNSGWALPTVLFARMGADPPCPPGAGAPGPSPKVIVKQHCIANSHYLHLFIIDARAV